MLVELRPEHFDAALRLYRDAGVCFPLISAVLQGKQRGQVFLNESPSEFAVAITNFGFMLVVGNSRDKAVDEAIGQLICDPLGLRVKYLLWYDPPITWQSRLDALGTETARRRNRIRFEFHKSRATWL